MFSQKSFAALVSQSPVAGPFVHFTAAIWNWLPLTPLGLTVLGLTWLGVQWLGGKTNDRIVLVGSVVVLLLVGICTAATLLTALWFRLRPTKGQPDLKLAVNQPHTTGFQLGWLAWNPLLKVELQWDNVPASRVVIERHYARLNEQITPGSRGEWSSIRRRFIIADVFGLSRCIFVRTTPARVRIEPDRHRAVPQIIAEQAISGDELASPDGKPQGDLLEIRRYVAGDPLKRVLWKTYARTGQLLVRSEERTRAATKKTLAYFVAGAGDEPTAAVARGMLETGSLGDNFTLGADHCSELANSAAGGLELLIQSKSAAARSGEQLARFLTRGAQVGASSCILFVPPTAGDWMPEVARALAGFSGKAFVVVAGGNASIAERKSSWRDWLVADSAAARSIDDTLVIRNRLTNKSTEVIVVAR